MQISQSTNVTNFTNGFTQLQFVLIREQKTICANPCNQWLKNQRSPVSSTASRISQIRAIRGYVSR